MTYISLNGHISKRYKTQQLYPCNAAYLEFTFSPEGNRIRNVELNKYEFRKGNDLPSSHIMRLEDLNGTETESQS